jgi:hypothetical protein
MMFRKSIGVCVAVVSLLLSQNVTAQNVDSPNDRTEVATVLGKPIYSESIVVPTEVNRQRKKLGEEEFERWLRSHRGRRLFLAINAALLEQYAKENDLTPTDSQIDAGVQRGKKADSRNGNPARKPGPHDDRFLRLFAYSVILEWKTSKALHEKYGGRLGIGSLGACVPIDARPKFLKEQQGAGRFRIHDAALRKLFWTEAADEAFADTVLEGDRVQEFFKKPPWQGQTNPASR